jgi:hypothetical protein
MYRKQQNLFLKNYVLLPVVCIYKFLNELLILVQTSKLEYRMLFPINETGNCRTTHLSFPLSWYLDRDTKGVLRSEMAKYVHE